MTAEPLQRLASFPGERHDRLQLPALLRERGFSLRAMRDDDLPWLRVLYASTRQEEMAPVPWPEIAKRNFLDQQFTLQHQHYINHFADADFLAIQHTLHGVVGRCYLLRTGPDHLIIDISLFPALRGHGTGSTLISSCQQDAAAQGRGMRLHVLHTNTGARRLYERLGFESAGNEGAHLLMRWRPEGK